MTRERIISEIRDQAARREAERARGNWVGCGECRAAIAALARVAGMTAAEVAEAERPAGAQISLFNPQPEAQTA